MENSLTQVSNTSVTTTPPSQNENLSSGMNQSPKPPTQGFSNQKADSGHRNFKGKSKHKQRRKGQRTQKQSQKRTTSVPRRGPVFLYVSSCCSLPARKPIAAVKVFTLNPDSGKSKETPKGLGHWKCSGCGKSCKVTRTRPTLETVTPTEGVTVPTVVTNG